MGRGRKTILIILGISIIILFISIAYAFLGSEPAEGNSTTNTISLLTQDNGLITVSFENGNNQIAAEFLELPEDEAGTNYYYMLKFQISSTSNIAQDIKIKWKDLINTFCQYKDEDNECSNVDTDTYVGDEVFYQLYSCTSNEYNNITEADDTDIASCTKISETSDRAVPVTDSETNLHNADTISLPENSTTYYVARIVLKNLITDQYYQQGKSLTGTINVINYSIYTLQTAILDTYTPVADNISSTYVSDESGINFSAISSPTNGQGLYLNNKNSGSGNVKYFRGGTYCLIDGASFTSSTACENAGGVWADYHCSLSDLQIACENAGGVFYELKNNVIFANYAWKIIRINADGSVRMIYNGTTSTSRGSDARVNTARYNNANYDTGTGPSNYLNEETNALEYGSYDNGEMETAINTWYSSNLASYSTYLSDQEFCSDTTWGNKATGWFFSPYVRMNTTFDPTFSCTSNESYTVANNKLSYPVASINIDEMAYAGGTTASNYNFYLQSGALYWTISPYYWNSSGDIYSYYMLAGGNFANYTVNNSIGIRPVINLKASVGIESGTGSLSDPWIIKTT